MKIQHASVPGIVTPKLVESLVLSVEFESKSRIREGVDVPANWNKTRAIVNQLYSIGVTLNQVSSALMRDIEAGDDILSVKSHAEQNEAPETEMWLGWLHTFHLAQKCLRAIEHATGAIDLPTESVSVERMDRALVCLADVDKAIANLESEAA